MSFVLCECVYGSDDDILHMLTVQLIFVKNKPNPLCEAEKESILVQITFSIFNKVFWKNLKQFT